MSNQKSKLAALMDLAAAEVMDERHRQNEKWGIQRHTDGDWLKILVEEVGELAQAMQLGGVSSKPTDAQNKLTEVLQVAAVAQAIAEQWIEEIDERVAKCQHVWEEIDDGPWTNYKCKKCGEV